MVTASPKRPDQSGGINIPAKADHSTFAGNINISSRSQAHPNSIPRTEKEQGDRLPHHH